MDLKDVKDAIQIVKDFEKAKQIELLNQKGLAQFAGLYKKYEAQLKIKQFIEETVSKEISPIQEQNRELKATLDILLDRLTQAEPKERKQIEIEEDEPEIDVNTIRKEVDEKINGESKLKKEFTWDKVESSPELDVYECSNGHKMNVIKNPDGTMFCSIDDGENIEVKGKSELQKMRKKVEEM